MRKWSDWCEPNNVKCTGFTISKGEQCGYISFDFASFVRMNSIWCYTFYWNTSWSWRRQMHCTDKSASCQLILQSYMDVGFFSLFIQLGNLHVFVLYIIIILTSSQPNNNLSKLTVDEIMLLVFTLIFESVNTNSYL